MTVMIAVANALMSDTGKIEMGEGGGCAVHHCRILYYICNYYDCWVTHEMNYDCYDRCGKCINV